MELVSTLSGMVLIFYVYSIVGLESRLEDAFVKWSNCCFYQLCWLLNWPALWFPHFSIYRCKGKLNTLKCC